MARVLSQEWYQRAFWAKVQKGSVLDGCWEWRGRRSHQGYGTVVRSTVRRQAHRVAWEMTNGSIPEGMWVRHRCDNPPCVNPAHLLLGQPAENSQDMVFRHRSTSGSRNPHATLTEDAVRQIRLLAADGISHRFIAQRFAIRPPTVSKIARRHRWTMVE